jgi:hypothetical protein
MITIEACLVRARHLLASVMTRAIAKTPNSNGALRATDHHTKLTQRIITEILICIIFEHP